MNYPEDKESKKARIKELNVKIRERFDWLQSHELNHPNWDIMLQDWKELMNQQSLVHESLLEGLRSQRNLQKLHIDEKVII